MPLAPPQSNTSLLSLSSGTSFPGTPATNDIYFRTDSGILYYYDGTRWLSVQEYVLTLDAYGVLPSAISANGDPLSGVPGDSSSGTVYLTKWVTWYIIQATNTLASHWTLLLRNVAGTAIDTFDSQTAGGAGVSLRVTRAINSVRTLATDHEWDLLVTKAGATALPGTLSIGSSVHYRLIG